MLQEAAESGLRERGTGREIGLGRVVDEKRKVRDRDWGQLSVGERAARRKVERYRYHETPNANFGVRIPWSVPRILTPFFPLRSHLSSVTRLDTRCCLPPHLQLSSQNCDLHLLSWHLCIFCPLGSYLTIWTNCPFCSTFQLHTPLLPSENTLVVMAEISGVTGSGRPKYYLQKMKLTNSL